MRSCLIDVLGMMQIGMISSSGVNIFKGDVFPQDSHLVGGVGGAIRVLRDCLIKRKNPPPSPYRKGMFPKICVADLRPQITSVLHEDKCRGGRAIMEAIWHAVGPREQTFLMLNN